MERCELPTQQQLRDRVEDAYKYGEIHVDDKCKMLDLINGYYEHFYMYMNHGVLEYGVRISSNSLIPKL